jgi:type I restriction enzyme S subunit
MTSEWCDVVLSDIIDLIGGGTPKKSFPEYWNGDIPWLSVKDFNHNLRYVDISEQSITELGLAKSSTTLLPKGYLIISARGTVGAISQLSRPMAFNQSCYGINAKSKCVTNDFLYYLIKYSIDKFKRMAHGAVFDTITRETFQHISVNLPPPPEQRTIVQVLGTLDDKIELNRHMNETLEEVAQAFFKSWFVDFDPVRAKIEGRNPDLPKHIADLFPERLVGSELGKIPEGWEVSTIGKELDELISGSRPRGGAVEFGIPSIGAENVIGLGQYNYSKEKYIPTDFFPKLQSKGADVRSGDVLLYKDGAHIGRKTYFDCNFPHSKCAVNEHVFILRMKRPEFQRYLFFWLDQPWVTQEIVSLNSNSAQPGINQVGVKSLPILLPNLDVISSFDKNVSQLTHRLFRNCLESRILIFMRDMFIPKLVSGKLRVFSS